ncbi:MAG: hypothetical protein WA821_14590 [Anaerolineales bacterium]
MEIDKRKCSTGRANFVDEIKLQIVGDAYNLSTAALPGAACQYHVSFIVTEKSHPRNQPQVYENSECLVCDARRNACK